MKTDYFDHYGIMYKATATEIKTFIEAFSQHYDRQMEGREQMQYFLQLKRVQALISEATEALNQLEG